MLQGFFWVSLEALGIFLVLIFAPIDHPWDCNTDFFSTFWKNTFYFMYGIWLIPWPGKIKQILCSDWLPKQARWLWSCMKKIYFANSLVIKLFSFKMTRHMACFCVFTDVDYSCQSIKHNLERISPIRYLTILTSCFKSVTCTHA